MKFNLSKSVTKVVVAEKTVDLTEVTVQRVVDLQQEKVVKAFMKELAEPLVLWSGAEYDAAGQWTDTDVQNRINELLTA